VSTGVLKKVTEAKQATGYSPRAARVVAVVAISAMLSACGFELRGSYELPYRTIYVTSTGSSVVAGQIRRELTDTKTRLLPSAKDADAALTILEERRDRQILSLSGAGRVREYELRMKVTYRFVDGKGETIIPTSEIELKRTFAYDDTRVIAKQQEETMLYQDMERDATGQILRRMIAVRRAG
jgi:LPS-assembly lipoprotein